MTLADAKDELLDLLSRCSLDEVRVLLVRMRRMDKARVHYGPLDLSADRRDLHRELAEERIDAAFYEDCLYVMNDDDARRRVTRSSKP